ncbi:MAG: efflux RND transporter periplasmic adaptor subunit [Burkholderiales bacterium]|nr:efflux RND transporter periplasmic adaptor subunit [Burkholderiales bacterium]
MTERSTKPPTPSSIIRRRLTRAGLAIVALGVLGAGSWYAWKIWGAAPAGDQYIFASIQRGDIEDLVSATGSLQPRDYVDVGAQVSGQLRRILVEVGSEVHEGDLLAEIDAEALAARVDASRAQLRARQADLVQQEVNLAKAQRDAQRQRNLMTEEATTLEAVQNAETTLAAARATISSTRAGIEQIQASMRVDETNLNYTKIYAPMSGTVASITAKQGQTLNTNQSAPTILRIADLSAMTVQTQVSEADVSRLRTGMPAYFTTLGSQGRRWWGQLKKIEPTPTVTNNVVLYNALFEVPNPNRALMTQMTAQVFFIVSEARDVLVAPMSALTIARPGPQGGPGGAGQRDRGAPGNAPTASAPEATASAAPAGGARGAAPSSAAARPAAGEAPRERRDAANSGERRVEGTGPRPSASAEGASRGDAAGERPRFDREAWGRMSDEERQRMRAEMQARRAAQGGDGASEQRGPGADARGERPSGARSADAARAANDRPAGERARTPATSGGSTDRPRNAGSHAQGSGTPTAAPAPRPPRKATVKVETAAGQVEEREVTIGVSNRVHAQILSGLAEGDRVVAGVKLPDTARRGQGQGGNSGPQGGPQGPGGLGGLGGGAAPGGRR